VRSSAASPMGRAAKSAVRSFLQERDNHKHCLHGLRDC